MRDLTPLLLVASLVLMAFAAAGVMLLRADERRRQVRSRTDRVVALYMRGDAPVRAAARRAITLPTTDLHRRLQRLIGMDPDRREPYPLRWWLVLPGAILPGRVAVWLMHGLFGPLAWGLLPLGWLMICRSIYRGADAKRIDTLYRQFPDALAMIVRAVRVGIPVSEAMRGVGRDAEQPTAAEFQRLHDQIGIGTAMEDALREMAERNQLPEYRFFATALSLQSQTGGGLTETLENLAEVIRKRVALKARGLALASEARTSASVLAALPVLAGLALAVLNPEYISLLLKEGPGQTLFGVAVGWLGLGMYVMRSMIRKTLS